MHASRPLTAVFYRLIALWIMLGMPTAQAAATPAADTPITLIVSTDNPEESLHVFALRHFAMKLRKLSGNRLRAEVHFRDSPTHPAVRGEEVNVNMVMSGADGAQGSIHATVVASGNAARKIPPLNLLSLPYLIENDAAAKRLFESELMSKTLADELASQYGVRVVGWLIGGFRHLTNSVRPVRRLADINGLKIRLPSSRVMVATYEAFGAQAVPLNWSDVPAALASGNIDGQENPYNVIRYSRFWEFHQKYLTTNGPFLWTGPLLVSERFFQQLSPELQTAVLQAGREAAKEEWAWLDAQEADDRQALLNAGMEITDLTDRADWIARAKATWPAQYAEIGAGDAARGKALLEQAQAAMAAN